LIASVINAVLVLLGGAFGVVFKSRIKERYSKTIFSGLSLCVLVIGMTSAVKTEDTLCVIISMVIGTFLGELLRIEDRLNGLGNTIKVKVMKNRDSGKFTEGFMTATLMFCIGSMAIMGSMEAGINGDYSIILSKSVIDCISAVTFAAAMGIGVCFSALPILLYQGMLTLLARQIGPFLPEAMVIEMSAVGGLLIIGLALNMLEVLGDDKRIPVGNMLPGIFLPIVYIPLTNLLSGFLG